MTTPRIFKPVYLSTEDGELGRLPDNAIINAGGVVGPNFTVGGRGLLFDDGTSTNPIPGTGFTLDVAYSNSTTPATINLVAGKDLIFDAVNSKKFIFDADTGTVTIEGDLNVLGASNVIEGTVSNLDQVNIRPPSAATVGLTIRPFIGITPSVNLVEVATTAAGLPVFSIGPTGLTSVTDLNISGLINGVPVANLIGHIDTGPAKHTAAQITTNEAAFTNISGSTVQEALESIDGQLTTIGVGNVSGLEYVPPAPARVWPINHARNTTRIQVTVWDDTNNMVLPDSVTITGPNTMIITFASDQGGRAILMLF